MEPKETKGDRYLRLLVEVARWAATVPCQAWIRLRRGRIECDGEAREARCGRTLCAPCKARKVLAELGHRVTSKPPARKRPRYRGRRR